MSLQIVNSLTPGLRQRMKAISDRRPVLEAMGLQLVSITKRAFGDASLRPAAWTPRKGTRLETNAKTGKQKTVSVKTGRQVSSLLRRSGRLYQSITLTAVGNDSATVGSDAPYAAVHQLGSKKHKGRGSGIPARPFFPFDVSGKPTPLAQKRVTAVAISKLRAILGT